MAVLNAPEEDLEVLASEVPLPIVECLYYHSVEGGKHLEYFDARAAGAWVWNGNACPRI